MNYYKAKQRQSTLRWDYTRTNDALTHPIGYCAGLPNLPSEELEERIPGLLASVQKSLAFSTQYHADGHATADEACACYRRYVLDQMVEYNQENKDTQHKCEVCQEWTTKFARVDHFDMYWLCDAHQNREALESLYPPVGECTSSY